MNDHDSHDTPQPFYSDLGTPRAPGHLHAILALIARPDVISFGGGLPSPAGFPVEAIARASSRVLESHAQAALQYSDGAGVPLLRQALADYETSLGDPTSADEILVTTGSQQALDLVARALVNPGDRILVERPTYLGGLMAFKMSHPTIEGLPIDEKGLVPESLNESHRGAKFVYTMPTYQNPTGITMDGARRQAIADKARELDLWLLEDNPYGELYYEKSPGLSLRTYAPERTIKLGTLSKVLAPGLRIGYIVAPKHVIKALLQLKLCMDLHTPTFTQYVAAEFIRSGDLKRHMPVIRDLYKHKASVMMSALDEFMPKRPDLVWTRPTGGMFLWVQFPEHVNAVKLLEACIQSEHPVAYVPGEAFYPDEVKKNCARMSFVTVDDDKIRLGVKTIAETLKTFL